MFSRLLILGVLLIAALSCTRAPATTKVQALPADTTLPPPVLIASNQPVFLIYLDGDNLNPATPPMPRLDTAVWSDGRIVWRVGDSLMEGKVDARKIDELLQRLHREGVFGNGKTYYGEAIPDHLYTVEDLRLVDRRLTLLSWNNRPEPTSQAVYTSMGMESLDRRNRDAVMAAQPPEWKRFRSVWSDIRLTVRSWIPPEGKPFVGVVPIDRDYGS